MESETIMVPTWLKSKFFWLNICAIILFVLNQILTSSYLPQWTVDINIAILVVTAVSNALAGTITSLRLKMARAKVAELTKQLNVHTQN